MAKKKIRKTNKKTTKKTQKKSSKIGIIIALAVIVLMVIFLVWKFGGSAAKDTEKVVGVINGEKLFQSDLDKEFARLPYDLQLVLDEEAVMVELIDKKLLLAEAENASTEIEEDIAQILVDNNITLEELEANVVGQGYTFEEFEEQLKIFAFLDKTLFSNLQVTVDEAKEYYDSNVEQFTLPESVKARHILVSTADRTDEEAMAIMNTVEAAFNEDNTKFCDLVTEYSEDPGSLEACGEYPAFGRDSNFVQEYKDTAFENEIGAAKVVKTDFGYHLIQTLEKTAEETLSFEEVYIELTNSLLFEKQKTVFADYMTQLRADSEIINCFETPEVVECSGEVVEEVVDETSLASFASCLTENGAKIYGAYWCSHCNQQKEEFGEALANIDYVECAMEDDPRAQTTACAEAGISGYPTWVIDGVQHPGKQSFETLSKLTGCSL